VTAYKRTVGKNNAQKYSIRLSFSSVAVLYQKQLMSKQNYNFGMKIFLNFIERYIRKWGVTVLKLEFILKTALFFFLRHGIYLVYFK
jgi:hypothetical protein